MNLTIKQFAERFGVSHRLVRYYDDIGLLHPSMRHSNGYRGYNEKNVEEFEKILVLKRFGFSLKEIRVFIDQGSIYHRKDHLLPLLQKRVSSLREQENKINTAIFYLDLIISNAVSSDGDPEIVKKRNGLWNCAAKEMGIVK